MVGKEFLDKKEKTVDSETKPQKTIEEGGLKYELVRTETKEELVSAARVETVTAFEDYPSAVTAEMVPKTKTVSVADPETGEKQGSHLRIYRTDRNRNLCHGNKNDSYIRRL